MRVLHPYEKKRGDRDPRGPAVRRAPGGLWGGIEPVRIRLLGGFEVSVGSRTVEGGRWRLRKAGNLVKLLALARGHSLHREQATDALWPELDRRSQSNNLHRLLHHARGVLEAPADGASCPYLTLRGDMLELCPEGPLSVDVEAFECAAAVARRGREPEAYRAAADLYAGELLPEDRYEPWAEGRREALRLTYLSLLLEMARLSEERGDYGRGIEALRLVVAEEPVHEEANAHLMRLLALRGGRGEAILQYGHLRRALLREFGAEPGPVVRRLYEEVRAGRVPVVPTPPVGRPRPVESSCGNLPASLTSFVGREQEAVEVKRLLSMSRLLTLTGAGGCGKTRLALETARDLVATYPDGVWLVELAALTRPELAPRALATALGVSEQAGRPLEVTLAEHLESGSSLVLLDNCEHLVDGAARLAAVLLNACPNLKILATSREPLGVPGEAVFGVPPLSLPAAHEEPTVGGLLRCEAVRLFVERARSRLPDFDLTPQNAGPTASVCRKLDGIPLAIELATARMGALAVEQVAERLEDSLGLLTGGARTVDPRQQTMRATLEWSFELLSEAERELFARLSVFAGGFTLEAAEAECPEGAFAQAGVLDLLSRLVDKSLVVAEATEGAFRYRMLEPVRQYGQERLQASGEVEAVRRRHVLWYLELAKGAEPWLRGDRQEVWLRRLEREHDNLRAALRWALESAEAELGLWFGGALGEFWYMRGYLSEGRRWLEAALDNGDDASRAPARTKALARAGWIAWEQGDYERSVALSKEGLALSRELGDRAGAAAALSNLSWAALLGNELARAAAFAGEAAALERSLGETAGVARALVVLGLAAVAGGDHVRAIGLHEESLALGREASDRLAMALSLVMGAFASLGLGDNRRAQALCEQSLAVSQRPRVLNVTAFQLHAAAALAGSQGRPARSARLWGAAASLRETIGVSLSPVELYVYGPYIDAARTNLAQAAWEEAWAEGKAMTVEEGVGYALEAPEREEERPARRHGPRHGSRRGTIIREEPPGEPDVLTPRQREIARLVARGMTNRQIASELSISTNTVANHVAQTIRRLGLSSRSLIAVWVAERGLRETQ